MLQFTLELSRVGCQLDSSGSALRFTDGTTVKAGAMHSIAVSEVATQKLSFHNLISGAAHYHILYCTETGPVAQSV
jgi:hypothetical protein